MMRLDTGNRAFLLLVGLAAALGAWIGLAACCVIGIVANQAGGRGVWMTASSGALRPALMLVVVLIVGSTLGVASVFVQAWETVRLARWVRRHRGESAPTLDHVAAATGLGGRVDVVDIPEHTAFTFGLASPRIVLSQGLVDTASPSELGAVLAHERHHARNCDPLKVFVARAIARAFFYLPVLRRLRDRYVVGRELAADRRAVGDYGRQALAGALYRAVSQPEVVARGAAAALGDGAALEARISQLETGIEPEIIGLSRASVLVSLAGGAVIAWSVPSSLVAFGGPNGLMARVCGA